MPELSVNSKRFVTETAAIEEWLCQFRASPLLHQRFVDEAVGRGYDRDGVTYLQNSHPREFREISILSPNNQRQHRTLHFQKDVREYTHLRISNPRGMNTAGLAPGW